MIKINGVKVESYDDSKSAKKPTLNQILDNMENNYRAKNYGYIENQSQNKNANFDDSLSPQKNQNSNNSIFENLNIENQKVESQSFDNGQNSDLLFSILPMLLSKNKTASTMKTTQNKLFETLIKNSNNPRLAKLAQLLPKILNNNPLTQTLSNTPAEDKNEPKIDSFKKVEE